MREMELTTHCIAHLQYLLELLLQFGHLIQPLLLQSMSLAPPQRVVTATGGLHLYDHRHVKELTELQN